MAGRGRKRRSWNACEGLVEIDFLTIYSSFLFGSYGALSELDLYF